MSHRPPPSLVVIEAKTLTYSRYVGKTCTKVVRAEEPLLPSEIEIFRTRPELLVPSDPMSA